MLRIDNGRLSLQTEIGSGPVLQQMRLGDLVLGSYNTCLHQWAGRSEWPRVNRVVHVNAQTQAHVLLVDLTSRFETAAPGGGPLPFEVTHRIWMAPGAEWFIIELLSCRNTSTRPMELRGIYFQPTSTIGGKTDGDKPASVHSVPRLWGRPAGDAWIDDTVGAFLGMVAPEGAPLQVSFWLNEWGGQHPDARWEVQHTLTPGEILRPKTPIYWIVLAGEGNQADWDTRQRTLAEIGRNDHR